MGCSPSGTGGTSNRSPLSSAASRGSVPVGVSGLWAVRAGAGFEQRSDTRSGRASFRKEGNERFTLPGAELGAS